MKAISKYINDQLSGVEHDKAYFDFKKMLIAKTTQRVNELTKSGLEDMKAVEAIVIGEHPNVKQEFLDYQKKLDNKNQAKHAGKMGSSIAALSVLSLVVVYLAVSFFTKAWAKTWLIIVGGVLVAVCAGLGLGIKKSLEKEKPNISLARLMSAVACMVACTFIFLICMTLLQISKSYIIFILGVAVALIVDVVITIAAKRKMLANLLIYIPVICALVYVTLGLFNAAVWGTGWLLILFGLVADIALIVINLNKKNSKK